MELRYNRYDVLLLDNHMPGYSGLWVLSEMQVENLSIPIVFMTGSGDERVAVKALKLGAQDYISKANLTNKEIDDAIAYAIKRKKEDLEFLARATRDPLTGVLARYSFEDTLEQTLSRAERKGQSFALLFIDLDKFKAINDIHGHQTGDQVLIEASQRMLRCLRRCDSLARLGGDEFVVILEDVGACSTTSSGIAAQRLYDAITTEYYCPPKNLTLGASIGISIFPNSGSDLQQLLRSADEAMYECKSLEDTPFVYHSSCSVIDERVQQLRLDHSNKVAKQKRN